jgi:hypothetical protein
MSEGGPTSMGNIGQLISDAEPDSSLSDSIADRFMKQESMAKLDE